MANCPAATATATVAVARRLVAKACKLHDDPTVPVKLDRCSRDAQDLLLSYLDRLPPARAVIGTSNLQLDLLTERTGASSCGSAG